MKTPLSSVLCLSLFLAACSGNTGNQITLVSDKVNTTESTYTLDLNIPQVKGLSDQTMQKDINDRLEKIATDIQTGFKKEIADIVLDPNFPKSGMGMDYQAYTLSPQIISLTINASPYSAGAAHPNHVTTSFTYDIDTKKEVTFVDLFNTKTKYLERLSSLTITQLIDESKKKGTYYEAEEQMIREGAAPKAENFANFAIQAGSLVLIFDPYQVGPYAEGVQSVTLSEAELTDVLSNEGRKLLSETASKK